MNTNAKTRLPQLFQDIIQHDQETSALLAPSVLPIDLAHTLRSRSRKRLALTKAAERFITKKKSSK